MRQSSTFHLEKDPSSKRARGIASLMHEALFLMNTLQMNPQVKVLNINNFELKIYYHFKFIR